MDRRSSGHRDHRRDVAGQAVGRHRDVHALGRTDGVGVGALVHGPDAVGPDAGGVDHHLGSDGELRGGVALDRTHHGTVRLTVGAHGHGDDRGVVGHRRAVLERRRPGQRQGQAGVVGPGVEVEEPGHQVIGVERGQMGQRLLLVDLLVALADAPASREVVEPQCARVGAGDGLGDHAVLAEERDQEGEGRDQVRRVVEQALALGQVLVDEPELFLLEVADAPVDHLGGLRRGARGEVVLLDQGRAQPPARRIQRDAGPGDAAPDDQHVERLAGQAAQGVVAAKGVHRSQPATSDLLIDRGCPVRYSVRYSAPVCSVSVLVRRRRGSRHGVAPWGSGAAWRALSRRPASCRVPGSRRRPEETTRWSRRRRASRARRATCRRDGGRRCCASHPRSRPGDVRTWPGRRRPCR